MKVRESTLDVGDRVLIRQVGLKGKHKLADKWQKHPYIVVSIPTSDIPVYKVQRESNSSDIKTLHRNMLLPFSAIPSAVEVSEPKVITKKSTRSKPVDVQNLSSSQESDSDQSESDSYEPRYIIPQKRNKSLVRNRVNSRPDFSRTVRDTSVPDLQSTSSGPDSLHTENSHNVPTVDNLRPDSFGDSILTVPSESSDKSQSVSLNADSNQPQSVNITTPASAPGPRRSARVRAPPDRYGEWIVNQETVLPDPDATQIWYV